MAGATDPARHADALGPSRPPRAHRRGSGRTAPEELSPARPRVMMRDVETRTGTQEAGIMLA